MFYEFDGINYILYNKYGIEIYKGESVAILFYTNPDLDCWDVLSHGDVESVEKEYRNIRSEYINAGFSDIARSIYVVKSDNYNVDELNLCLNIQGYIVLFLSKQYRNLDRFKCYAKNGYESIEMRELKDSTEEIHKKNHNYFAFWENCKQEPCLTNSLKVTNLYNKEKEKKKTDMKNEEKTVVSEVDTAIDNVMGIDSLGKTEIYTYSSIFSDVDNFIVTLDQDKEKTPKIPSGELLRLRKRLINEEWNEILTAINEDDLAGYVDGCLDLIYVVAGALLAAGVPYTDAKDMWDMVQSANMAKIGGEKDEFGKIQKPKDWSPPDIEGHLKKIIERIKG